MKIIILLLSLLSYTITANQSDYAIKINDLDDYEIRKDRQLENFSPASMSEDESEETRDINDITAMGTETVDTNPNNVPKFELDNKSIDSQNVNIGEIDEMKNLVGKRVNKTVPNALHHHVVFPWTFPHVGMFSTHNHLQSEEADIDPVEE